MVEQDKPRISVKLNGKEHSFHEIEKVRKEKDLQVIREKTEETEHTKLKEPKEEQELKNSQVPPIHQALEGTSLGQHDYFANNIIDFNKLKEEREIRKEPYWDDGNREWSPKLPPVKRKKKTAERLKKSLSGLPISLILAGVSAIIVGVGFGFMVLTAFTGEADGNTASLMPQSEVIETATNGQAGEITLPDLSVEIVQGGAFSTSEKGNEIVSLIKQRGQAAVLKTDSDPMYMFIGLGLQKDEAGRISQLYQQQGQETYVKPFAVNGSLHSVDSEAVKQYFTQGGAMFNELARFSVAGLAGQSVALENIEKFLGHYQEWNKQGTTIIAELPEGAQGHAKQFISSMAKAASEIEGYKGKQQEIRLWGIQQHLLEALLSYEALIHALK